ncbi:diguanylate cyclase [Sneathiella sp. P13V-1]|uniref:GGDEF domain-containing protein n=1 Tax=Sneathiella sp. P13V-1 TaxID=2697366 RepID=UPI00187BB637|nr:GGDEF domain-containing protein [Sneathiella sp. P13V-1]MBE7637380.1 diguanylate cyclase [Sneathiella sp. P13V-1]
MSLLLKWANAFLCVMKENQMGVTYSFKKAALNAQKTMALLEDRKIKKIPQNFTIWFEYLSDENPEIKEVVNRLIAERGKFNDEVAQQIYNEFFSHEKESKQIRETNRLMQQSMETLLREIRCSSNGLTNYEETLENFAGSAEGSSVDEMQHMVARVINETRQMSAQSKILNESLNQASAEIDILREKLETIEHENLTDSLTGIANRKRFDMVLEEYSERSKNGDTSMCLVMSDIDHFKKFNDDHGHLFGDQVLKLVAQTLHNGINEIGIAARYGGEEFGIILPETNINKAIRLADELRESVSSKKLVKRNTGTNVGKITMSFGVAQFDPKESINDFVSRADQALYCAKAAGRNQVKTFNSSMQISA